MTGAAARRQRGFVQALGEALARWSERFVPDPFVLAIGLTLLSLLLALVFFQAPAGEAVGLLERGGAILDGWVTSFFRADLLTFAFQICVALVTGHALATTRVVQRLIARLARWPRSTSQAAVIVAITAVISGYIHWGLGAVVGAFLAREIGRAAAREKRPLHYPLLGAAAYMGLLVWHGGLSGSAPLVVATEGHFLEERIGVITTDQTMFSTYNLAVTVVLAVLIPLLCWLMARREPAQLEAFRGELDASPPDVRRPPTGLAARLDHGPVLSWLIGGVGLGWVLYRLVGEWVDTGRLALNLNVVNFVFLFLGILLQGSPRRYVRAASAGARGCAGIIVQFPFYFGILGLLQASGLIQAFARGLADLATAETLPVFTFFSAGVVNLFVPSGGGQWAVQGEILVESVSQTGANLEHTIMAFCYGDQLTNMLQPFWALPLLGITGLKARQIIGYTGAVMLLVMPVLVVLLLILN